MNKQIINLFILPLVKHLLDEFKADMQPSNEWEKALDSFYMWLYAKSKE